MGSLRRFVTLFESLQPTPGAEARSIIDIRLDEEMDTREAPPPEQINEAAEGPALGG
ncbi:MAG: hypothetical protein ACAH11_06535 [Sphingomonas sp.]